MRVIRAHDGVAFDLTHHHLANVDRLATLVDLLSHAIHIDSNNIILMNALGSQLSDSLLRSILDHLSHSPPDSLPSSQIDGSPMPSSPPDSGLVLYAFDRHYLSADPSETLHQLRSHTQDALEPPLPPYHPSADPDQVDSLALAHHNVGSIHLRTTLLLLSHVRAQKAALQVALHNLDKCRESPRGALEAYETFAQPLVRDYGHLLAAFGPALALAKKIEIHPNLLPPDAVLKPSPASVGQLGTVAGGPELRVKYMGDYVMEDRILQIRDRCLNVYQDFRARFDHIRASSAEVHQGALQMRAELDGPGCDLSDLHELEKDADEGFRRVEEVALQVAQLAQDEREALGELFGELRVLDEDSRERIACLIERKNFWLHHLVGALNRISSLQGIIPTIGAEVHALNADLKTRTDPFRHLARLKDFVTAYAATVVEVVRRREFARHLSDYASALASSLSKLATEERRRRLAYRSEYGGKMPFVVDGLDDTAVPTIEFEIRRSAPNAGAPSSAGLIVKSSTATSSKDHNRSMAAQLLSPDLPVLTRADVDEMIATLRKIEESSDRSSAREDHDSSDSSGSEEEEVVVDVNHYSARVPAREVRHMVEKQFGKLEAMENAFAMAVEKFVMSESESCAAGQPVDAEELAHLRDRVAELESANATLSEQLRLETTASITASRKAQQETQIQMRKAEDLKLQLLSVKEEARHERERLLQDQQSVINELGNTAATTRKLTARIGELEEEARARSKSLQDAERLVASARATADEATRELHELEGRHRDQVSDHHVLLSQLDQARERTGELEQQLGETKTSQQELAAQLEAKKQMLESQASSAEQVRLQMEQSISELSQQLSDEQRQNDGLRNKVSQQQIDIEHLNQQLRLQAEAHVAAESRSKEETDACTARLERHCVAAVEALQSYQQASRRIKDRIVAMPRPGSSQRASTSVVSPTKPVSAGDTSASDEPERPLPPPSSAEFEALLQSLLQYELSAGLGDLVQQKLESMSSQIRKWMKQSKGYAERAKTCLEQAQVKITFRDFAKGDLALFLPTRNPTAQVWAAFNVSFPHYFLEANEAVGPIIRNREWLVARIVELREKLVDLKEPETNPYQLPAGTRYFLLQVEPWSVEKTARSKMAQSLGGADSPTRSKTQTQTRATTVAGPSSKRDSEAAGQAESSKPSTVASVPATPTSAAHVDLSQSEFTVIDHLSSPPVPDADGPSDSPFRTALGSPAAPAASQRAAPSGLALSLRGYHKSPLGSSGPGRRPSGSAEAGGGTETQGEMKGEFRPSESARPAFLASLSLGAAQVRRAGGSTFEPPQRPRARPVPKAHTASRSSSRAPSVGGTSVAGVPMSSPTMKALLRAGVQTSKGSTTVSTTFASMEKAPSSPSPMVCDGEAGKGVQANRSGVGGEQQAGRVSFPGTTNLSMMLGSSGGNGSSTTSLSSLGGSGGGVATATRIRTRTESTTGGGGGLARSPSGGVGSIGSGTGGLTSSIFGGWRRNRRESGTVPSSSGGGGASLGGGPPASVGALAGGGPLSGTIGQGLGPPPPSSSSSSFVGASELLKRFSSSGGG